MAIKKFDLNIEQILDNWEIYHGIREIIANAIDETILSRSEPIDIFKSNDCWHIRDYGRGLNYQHFTQNENIEKQEHPNIIGKFGIGLKDALATFNRRGVDVRIKSKYADIQTEMFPKEDFSDVNTLHAVIDQSDDPNFIGSEFILKGVCDDDINKAKKLFLMFSNEKIIDTTKHGQIVFKNEAFGSIYINGVKVAEEENFLFSYNITNITAPIKKALNRERSNVGRTAYSESIKKILLSSTNSEVALALADELKNISEGTARDELKWIDVQEHTIKILNSTGEYIFLSASDSIENPNIIDLVKSSGRVIITIPENLKQKISSTFDNNGNPIVDAAQFIYDYTQNFEYKFVPYLSLNTNEKMIFDFRHQLIEIFGGLPDIVNEISISETMQPDLVTQTQTLGCWDRNRKSIIISRSTLNSLSEFSGVLIHELVHAKTSLPDVNRQFETELTHQIGFICEQLFHNNLINKQKTKKPWFKLW